MQAAVCTTSLTTLIFSLLKYYCNIEHPQSWQAFFFMPKKFKEKRVLRRTKEVRQKVVYVLFQIPPSETNKTLRINAQLLAVVE